MALVKCSRIPETTTRTKRAGVAAALLGFSVALVCLFALDAFGATPNPPKRVLLLHSFGRDFEPFSAVSSGFRTALAQQSAAPIEFLEVSLETARFTEGRSETPFVEYLRALFAKRAPALVVPFGAPAMNFLQRHRQRLFPGVPMLVASVDERRLKGVNLGANAHVVAIRLDLPGIVENILRLLPATKNVAVVIGNSPLERFWLAELRRDFQPFTGRVSFTWLNQLSLEEMRRHIATIPRDSAILYAVLLVDAAGVPHEQERALDMLHAQSGVPIFGAFDNQLGRGIVGGPLYPIEMVSRESARLALRILSGEAASDNQRVTLGPGPPVFDWRELRRWGIAEDSLPAGSIIRFRQPAFWEQYKWPITLVVGLCVLEAVLISVLLRERRRRRLVQQKVEERLRYEQLVSELSNMFINLPSEDVEDEIVSALGRVATLLKFDIAVLSTFTGQDGHGRVAYIWRAEGVPEIPPGLTYKDFPWSAEELFAGRDVCLRSLEMLPLAARTDRATYEKYHVRSSYSVPMVTGGRVIGVLGLNTVWEEHEMPSELLQGQRLLGEIFANALARKAAEQSLRESEENLRNLVETTTAVPWQADVETWVFTYVGPQAVKLLGYPIEQWYQKDFWVSHLHPDDKEFAISTCVTNSQRTENFEFEYRMIAASGKSIWVHDIVKCEHRNGKPAQLRGFILDISERKQAEDKFRLAVEASPNAIVMVNPQGEIMLVNEQTEKLFGYTRAELIGQPIEMLVPERFRRAHPGYRAEFFAKPEARPMGAGRDLFARRKDGSEVMVEIGLNPIQTHDGLLVLTAIVDVSARKQAEEALKKERAFLRQVIDIDPNFIFAKDRGGRFTLVNQAVADAYGATVDDLIGKTDADFNPNREEVESFRRMDLEVMDTLQERFIAEEHITDAQGRVRWLQTVKRPIIEKDGSAHQVLGASSDITQRKENERELGEQRAEIAHVTRISTMGELAASLAHELNQPLTAILSNAQAALRFMTGHPATQEDVREILREIVQDNNRASEVIRRMRALVKKEKLDFAALNLASVIGDVVGLVRSDAILHGVQVLLEFTDGLAPVWGDRVQLQQVMLNLLLNAFDAMKECPAHERQVVIRATDEGAEMLEVAVCDQGTGLSGDKLDKIFQPFYTTKGEGLGMGLSICRSIVEAHGGRLWAENNPDRGATFYFTVRVQRSGER